MSDEEKNQWYTNKDLFEQINGLRAEMQETRFMIKKYNGLREEVGKARNEINEVKKQTNKVKKEVETLQAQAKGRSSVWKDIRVWVSLAFSFCMLIVAIAAIIYN